MELYGYGILHMNNDEWNMVRTIEIQKAEKLLVLFLALHGRIMRLVAGEQNPSHQKQTLFAREICHSSFSSSPILSIIACKLQ